MTYVQTIHGCGECGIRTLVLEPARSSTGENVWRLSCPNGHRWVPIPGTVITINITPAREGAGHG